MSVNVRVEVEWTANLALLKKTFEPDPSVDMDADGWVWIRHSEGNTFLITDMECSFQDHIVAFMNVVRSNHCLSMKEL